MRFELFYREKIIIIMKLSELTLQRPQTLLVLFLCRKESCAKMHVENCKTKFKFMNCVHSTMLSSHLDEFMWRFGKTHDDAFNNIFSDINRLF